MDGTPDGISLRTRSRFFEDFTLGERYVLPPRVMSRDVFDSFRHASGETHPLHHDTSYCRALDHPGAMAHGFQVLMVTTAGAGGFHDMVEDSLLGLVEQSCRFLRPAFDGDTLHPVLQVTELAPNSATGVVGLRSTVHNQRRELLLEGTQYYLLRKRGG